MNILSNPTSFDLWSYRHSPGGGYAIIRDGAVNPYGTSNLADIIVADVGAYGGLSQAVTLQPNTTYYFSVWMYRPIGKGGSFLLKINQIVMGTIYWPGNATPGYSLTGVYVAPPQGTVGSPTPWTQYTWTFTTPSTVDNTKTCTITIDATGASVLNGNQLVIWGAALDTINTAFVELSTYIYSMGAIVSNSSVPPPSVDLVDAQGVPQTSLFDIHRYTTRSYSLLPPEVSYNYNYWSFIKSNTAAGGTQKGITLYPGIVSNPFGTSSLTTFISQESGASGGMQYSINILPNTVYTISFWAYGPTSNGSSFSIYLQTQTTLGTPAIPANGNSPAIPAVSPTWVQLNWMGLSNPIGSGISIVYAGAPKSVSGSTPWANYVWTFTTPPDVVTSVPLNGKIYFVMAGAVDLMMYGFTMVKGNVAQNFVEPLIFNYDINTLPQPNPYLLVCNDYGIVSHLPSIDTFDSNGYINTTLFDILRLNTFSKLGKYAFPYGNTFDKLTNNIYEYTFDQGHGMKCLGNLMDAPIDPINNPVATTHAADLIEPSSDPAMLTSFGGGKISWDKCVALIAGKQYTLSCWVKSKYVNLNGGLYFSGGGNWLIGEQAPGSEGDLTHPAWKTMNGTYTIVRQSISNNQGLYTDMGYPADLPLNKALFTKRADHIRAIPGDGSSLTHIKGYTNSTIYDLSTAPENTLPPELLACKYSTLVYQEFPYDGVTISRSVDFWGKFANDYVSLDGNGHQRILLDPLVSASIVAWAVLYPMADGTTLISVQKNWGVLTEGWRMQPSGFDFKMYNSPAPQDPTKPVGFGMFFTGDLAVYGGLRVYNNTAFRATSVSMNTSTWTRVSVTFTAIPCMEDLTYMHYHPGGHPAVTFPSSGNSAIILSFQPGEPAGNTTMLPWSPKFSAFYAYGLMINEGPTPGPYFPDMVTPIEYRIDAISETSKVSVPHISYATGDIPVTMSAIRSITDYPEHHLGINMCDISYYTVSRAFLNLMKVTRAGPDLTTHDVYGVDEDKQYSSWWSYREYSANWAGAAWNTFGNRTELNYLTLGYAGDMVVTTFAGSLSSDNWWTYTPTDIDRTIVGEGIAPGTKVISRDVVDDGSGSLTITWTLDRPLVGNTSWTNWWETYHSWTDPATGKQVACSTYYIKKEIIDDTSYYNLDGDGYPRTIPTGHSLYTVCYRPIPVFNYIYGTYVHPIMPTTDYVITWDGEGHVALGNAHAGLSGYPTVEASRTSNRAVYHINCSGNTSTGVPVRQRYALPSDPTPPLSNQSMCGFVISISSTDPNGTGNHVRNIRLCEAKHEARLNAGEIFYPEYISRLRDTRCLRFLPWAGQSSLLFNQISTLTPVSAISYASETTCVPHEVIIALCNQTKRDCWLNVQAGGSLEFYKHIAELYETTLDPSLRLYIEYSNEIWNSSMGGSQWIDRTIYRHNVVAPGLTASANIVWDTHMWLYAKLSQECFNVFNSVFSGNKAALHPVRVWDNPKFQKRRLMRMLSTWTYVSSITDGVYNAAKQYAGNCYGIPFDGIAAAGYYGDLQMNETVGRLDISTSPNDYPYTMNDIIPLVWAQLADEKIISEQHIARTYSGILGVDTEGDPHHPIWCHYEGGFGSSGPTHTQFKVVAQIKFEEDGDLHTMYNLQKDQYNWWETTIVPWANGDESCVYNLWQMPGTWNLPAQWAITDKDFYTDTEFYNFPLPKVIAEFSNIFPLPTVAVPPYTGPSYASKPQMWDGTQWVDISNVHVYNASGNWVEKRADIVKYYSGIDWT